LHPGTGRKILSIETQPAFLRLDDTVQSWERKFTFDGLALESSGNLVNHLGNLKVLRFRKKKSIHAMSEICKHSEVAQSHLRCIWGAKSHAFSQENSPWPNPRQILVFLFIFSLPNTHLLARTQEAERSLAGEMRSHDGISLTTLNRLVLFVHGKKSECAELRQNLEQTSSPETIRCFEIPWWRQQQQSVQSGR
jgi:uncharacterized Fe-S cluster protein YjdI